MLRVGITKLWGPVNSGADGETPNAEMLGQPQQFTNCEVEIPYANDARIARVTVSIYDEIAKHIRPLDRMLKIWYRYEDGGLTLTRLVFWGPITNPEWDLDAGTVTINAHDPSLRLKHSYVNHSDTQILDPALVGPDVISAGTMATGSVTTDGDGMRALRDSGNEVSNFPTLGIANGYNTNPQAPLMNNGQRRNMKVVRGDESWQKMVDLSKDQYAPDFEIEPWDGVGDYPGAQGLVDVSGGPWAIADALDARPDDIPSYLEIPVFVDLRHNVSKLRMNFYLRHTYVSDMRIRLRHPDGTEVKITEFDGGSRDGWGVDATHRLWFDEDEALFGIGSSSAPSPYIVGTVAPHESFHKLRGKPAYGTWKLIVEDLSSGDSGTLYNFALSFDGRGSRIVGQYARMHTWNKADNDGSLTEYSWSAQRLRLKGPPDKRGQCVFQYGFGTDNVETLTYSPGGDRVLNYYVAVTESNADSRPQHRATKQVYRSRELYGTFMGWQAVGADINLQTTGPEDVLNGVADQFVSAYGYPPQFVTFTPKRDDSENSLMYVRDFWPGDTVKLHVKKGALALDLDVFVTKVTLKQLNEANESQVSVEAVPTATVLTDDPGATV